MPLSCLYSLSDGVVPPQEATVDGDPALHENIRVPGSHIGLGFNAVVLWIVAERLSQPLGHGGLLNLLVCWGTLTGC
jgi:hypothetical protein